MSAMFPISELLALVMFGATVITAMTKAAPRPRRIPVDQLTVARLLAARSAQSGSRSDADFPSSTVC